MMIYTFASAAGPSHMRRGIILGPLQIQCFDVSTDSEASGSLSLSPTIQTVSNSKLLKACCCKRTKLRYLLAHAFMQSFQKAVDRLALDILQRHFGRKRTEIDSNIRETPVWAWVAKELISLLKQYPGVLIFSLQSMREMLVTANCAMKKNS